MITCCFNKSKKLTKKLLGCKEYPQVACVNLSGVIGKDSKLSSGLNFENVAPLLEKAFKVKDVKAVAININSPGGSPVQSELIYNYIRELATDKKIPTYTFAQDVAASGGYFLLIAGDEIYAHNSSILGSIGVIFSSFGFVELIKKIGVSRRIYTEGKNKAILDPFLPEQDENIEILKEAQHDIFESFRDLVKERRQGKLKGDDDYLNNNVFTGAFWSGKKSLELGLIDGIADMRSKMKEKFGKDVKIVKISAKKSFLKSFFSERVIDVFFDKIETKIKFSRFGL